MAQQAMVDDQDDSLDGDFMMMPSGHSSGLSSNVSQKEKNYFQVRCEANKTPKLCLVVHTEYLLDD